MANIIPTLERKGAVVRAAPQRHSGLRGMAQDLDRRLAVAATVELVTEALSRLAALAYTTDRAGWVNVDVTGRILIPVPWGKRGRDLWGLYPSEGLTLNRILRSRQRRKRHVPLFAYDTGRRAWYVDLAVYPDLPSAYTYIERRPISVEEWRHFYTTGR